MAKRRSNKEGRHGKSSREVEADVPYGLNEVDDFASKREKILLNESTLGGAEEDEDVVPDEEEEEVMGMSDEESSEEEVEDDDQYDDELDAEGAYKKVFGRKLDLGPDSVEDEEGMLANENAWGSTKGEYYGADDLDDDETAKEIEKEALRQKKKHAEEMNMGDYLDDDLDEEWTKEAKNFDVDELQESTNQKKSEVSVKDIMNMDAEARQEYLNTLFPEFLPLSKELAKLTPVLEELKSQKDSETKTVKIIALSSYLGVLSSYFGIFLHESRNNEEFNTMKDHPVMEMLLTTKEVWRQASNLPDNIGFEDVASETEDLYVAQYSEGELSEFDPSKLSKLQQNIAESDVSENNERSDNSENTDESESEEDDVDLDDFEEYVALSRVGQRLNEKEEATDSEQNNEVDDYVEGEIADVDAQEKKARRKTLRFYTSKIDQQENKKIDKFKGDDDIPYKERLFERQQRLIEEARKRGLHDKNGEDLDSKDYDSNDEATSNTVNSKGETDYFNLIKKNKQDKQDARRQSHKAAIKAAKDGKLAELAEQIGEDGKRAINYQILKNKGLTPKRKKDNRNSRVKKRKKYEKAQKKLKSVRAVYSGGQNGVYEGEKTGIKKNLVKSVKFKM